MGCQQGFTLLELLVVLLIIGIVVGVAMIVPSAGGPGQTVKDEALRLQTLMEQARDRALLENTEMGLSMTGNGYRWWIWSRDEDKWRLLNEQSFREYRFPDNVVLTNYGDSSAVTDAPEQKWQDLDNEKPAWIFSTDTQVTPFRFEFTLRDDHRYSVILESDGVGPVQTP
ncbi:type II secretion system minor pseudopilin GspH [Sansalvadorimonas verongulae]|uniref:type II secretion system minor pseudopilin GspH n=1 Tax=Sansalvadorimonas verongulae TaxID=2172824 RepID=UPI0012BB676D|nr:type II secretion system minor pseudopilin GspH [Sansalvadorimonas verongulae]MTI14331.1 type II secretion system protein GspH [Sansalvadorimonas verongulae]